MFIQPLEDRRLLSATPTEAQVLAKFRSEQAFNALMKALSTGGIQKELGIMLMTLSNKAPAKAIHPATATSAATPATATAHYLTVKFPSPGLFAIGKFNPASLEPFGATYTVKLNPKTPLTLFNLTKKIGKETLHFTAIYNAKLTSLSGLLKVTGPTNQISFTYTATPKKTT